MPRAAPQTYVQSLGPTSLRVEWDELTATLAQGEIIGYKVIYRPHNENSMACIEYVMGSERELILTGKLSSLLIWHFRRSKTIMASFEELDALVKCVLFVSDMQFQLDSVSIQRPLFQVSDDISTMMIRSVVSWDYLNFIMGIPIVARLHLQIEIVSWLHKTSEHGPLTRYVQLRVAHAPRIVRNVFPTPTSKETAT